MNEAKLRMGDQSNGLMDCIANAHRFLDRQTEVYNFEAYVYQGTLSVRRVPIPVGHFKFPHPWPGQIPPGRTCRL